MPTGIEVTKQALDDFKKIQEYMLLAKKENAEEVIKEIEFERRQIERKLYQKPPLVSE